jgi:hypothetical protein
LVKSVNAKKQRGQRGKRKTFAFTSLCLSYLCAFALKITNYDTQSYNGLTRFWLVAFLLLPSYFLLERPFTKTTPGRLRQAVSMRGLQPVTQLSMPFGAAYYSQSTFVY